MAQVRQADQRHPRPEQLWLLWRTSVENLARTTANHDLYTGWAFAGAEAASDRMCIATDGDKALPISAQDVCFNSNLNGCNGGQITTPWTYIRWRGAVSGGQYNNTGPFGNMGLCSNWGFAHCHHHGPQRDDPYPDEGAEGCKSDKSPPGPTKCDNTAKGSHADFKGDKYKFHGTTETASGEEKIQRMIMEGGPVETAFTVWRGAEINRYTPSTRHRSCSMA